ncbi:hypothetical protein VUR80DRAFT_3364 [Thermomyces stellatus]
MQNLRSMTQMGFGMPKTMPAASQNFRGGHFDPTIDVRHFQMPATGDCCPRFESTLVKQRSCPRNLPSGYRPARNVARLGIECLRHALWQPYHVSLSRWTSAETRAFSGLTVPTQGTCARTLVLTYDLAPTISAPPNYVVKRPLGQTHHSRIGNPHMPHPTLAKTRGIPHQHSKEHADPETSTAHTRRHSSPLHQETQQAGA